MFDLLDRPKPVDPNAPWLARHGKFWGASALFTVALGSYVIVFASHNRALWRVYWATSALPYVLNAMFSRAEPGVSGSWWARHHWTLLKALYLGLGIAWAVYLLIFRAR